MRFIPGFKFKIDSGLKRSASLLQTAQMKKFMREDEHFKRDNNYELSYVRPRENKFFYYFLNQTTGDKFELEFSSIAEADRKLEKLIGLDPVTYIEPVD